MIFRQLFEPLSSTYTYLLGCEQTGKALLVDPVLPAWERGLEAVRALHLELAFTVETHVHAAHLTSAALEARSRKPHRLSSERPLRLCR